MRITDSPFSSAVSVQPTPQYAQVVLAVRSGAPIWTIAFSVSAPVGDSPTHAPQDTHSDAMNGSSWLAAIFECRPRPCTVRANVPWVSSQARTQREHTMHRLGSNSKYGLLWSFAHCSR